MQKEIGSNFWLSPEEVRTSYSVPESFSPSIFGYHGNDFVWMSTGRSATALVIKSIEARNPNINKIVCLPPFTCHTVFEPFLEVGYKVVTFPIGTNLVADGSAIVKCAVECRAGIVLFHRYFGFDTILGLDNAIHELRAHGIITIEDATQSLYSDFVSSGADFYVASIRKWCGVPDGGFAVCREGKFRIKPTEADRNLGLAKIEASLQKHDWIVNGYGDKETFLNSYRGAEDILNAQDKLYTVYPLSLVIQARLDTKNLQERRRKNFLTLLNSLQNIHGIKSVFGSLPEGAVPLYFPVYCDDRKSIQSLLVRNNIYAPIVWPKADNCPVIDSSSEYIYDHILCIPIDQRYDSDDMERIVKVLKRERLWTGWMTWEQIEPFKEQLIDWELEVMVKYHYPDKKISRDYPASRVENLKEYLESGNTFFWGAIENEKLLGYYWAYVSDFLGYRRWQSRSSYTCESARGRGISKMAHQAALTKASELKCDEAVSSYAHFNKVMAHIYQNLGYEPSRIEIVKKLSKEKELPPRFANALNIKDVQFTWMTWEQIEPFKEQLIDWELEVMVKYHYPDKIISRDYPASRVINLKNYLASGNTFFWGAILDDKLLGYYWAYIKVEGTEKIWEIRSNFISEKARNIGLGMLSYKAGLDKAVDEGCTQSISMYAAFNTKVAEIYDRLGYEISKVEVIKKIYR